MITYIKRVNQYLTIQVQFDSFPEIIDPKKYEYFGHLQGERINLLKEDTICTGKWCST